MRLLCTAPGLTRCLVPCANAGDPAFCARMLVAIRDAQLALIEIISGAQQGQSSHRHGAKGAGHGRCNSENVTLGSAGNGVHRSSGCTCGGMLRRQEARIQELEKRLRDYAPPDVLSDVLDTLSHHHHQRHENLSHLAHGSYIPREPDMASKPAPLSSGARFQMTI